jgi:YegS/Rv2252/BmrU family lipid kinase
MNLMTVEIPVIVNAKSGPDGEENSSEAIEAAFRKHGMQARVIMMAPGQDITQAVQDVLADHPPLVVAGGGDGTINAVASHLLDGDVTLGVLPLGTLTHFARDLQIPFELEDAARIIADGHRITVDVGEVNDHIFLNNSSMGLYPTIVAEREQHQKYSGLGKWPALVKATFHAMRDPACFNAVVCIQGQQIDHRTPFIFVGNNPYIVEGFSMGKRKSMQDGILSLYILHPKKALGLFWLGLRSLLGMGSHAGDFDDFQVAEFRIESQNADIEVATDGEIMHMHSPICYRIRPRALQVLAPRPVAAAARPD